MISSLLLIVSLALPSSQVGPQNPNPNRSLRDWAETGQTEAVRELLAGPQPVDVDYRDAHGWSALMYALKGGHDDIVKILVDAGANVRLKNNDEESALHIAAKYGRSEATRLLLDAGADISTYDATGRTPLYRAIENKQADIIELLQAAAQELADHVRLTEKNKLKEETIPPENVHRVPAQYTDTARAQGIEGTVVLMALVRRDGSVGDISISESLEESLDQSALEAVKEWKFVPATRGGMTVEVVVEIKIEFKLSTTP
jgi:TonB family protein